LQVAKVNFEALLQRAAKILATLSGYIALVTFPQNLNSTLHHLQLVRVAANQVMLIVVTDGYQTQSILMESPLPEEDVDESTINHELQLLSNFLDQELRGRSLSEIVTLDWTTIDREFSHYTSFLEVLLSQLKLSFEATKSSPMVIHGIAELLRQPEFSQLQQALISANYYQNDLPVGSVGILGPKRMLYENAIALVENTADYLSNPFQVLA